MIGDGFNLRNLRSPSRRNHVRGHLAWLVVTLAACKKGEAPPPAPVTPSGPAPVVVGAPDAGGAVAVDASAALIELLRSVPATVRVSSTVANPKILPSHLVDRDLATAWNSATGELVGAWIEITVDPSAQIDEVRLTAGFTGKGPKGEDYFTMNPRIRKLKVISNGTPAGVAVLDITRRDLQVVSVPLTNLVRLEIAEIEPGTRKTWREASVSELEVWGAPPSGWKQPAASLSPTVMVGEVVAPVDASGPCADTDKRREEFIEAHKNDDNSGPGGEDHNYPPTCSTIALPDVAGLDAVWAGGEGTCEVNDEIYGPTTCVVVFTRGSERATFGFEVESAHGALSVVELKQVDVVAGGPKELVVRYESAANGEQLVVCRSAPTLDCSQPIVVADDSWTTTQRFVGGQPVLKAATGTPPAAVLGAHVLTWK